MLKSIIRKEIKDKLNRQNKTQRLRKSRLIKEKLFKLSEFRKARYVMFYVATAEEVETDFMIQAAQKIGKKVVVPTISKREKHRIIASLMEDFKKELEIGPYGVSQPRKEYIREVPNEKIDLVIVPGLAFDRRGNRLGRGGGCYDRFLAALSADIPRIGLAFDFQVIKNLPVLSHDICVTKVISA